MELGILDLFPLFLFYFCFSVRPFFFCHGSCSLCDGWRTILKPLGLHTINNNGKSQIYTLLLYVIMTSQHPQQPDWRTLSWDTTININMIWHDTTINNTTVILLYCLYDRLDTLATVIGQLPAQQQPPFFDCTWLNFNWQKCMYSSTRWWYSHTYERSSANYLQYSTVQY